MGGESATPTQDRCMCEWADIHPRSGHISQRTAGCILCQVSHVTSAQKSCDYIGCHVTCSERMSQDKKQCSYLYFINLVTTEETMATVRHDTGTYHPPPPHPTHHHTLTAGLSPWDMNECLRQIQLGSHSLHNYPHFERVVSTCHEG